MCTKTLAYGCLINICHYSTLKCQLEIWSMWFTLQYWPGESGIVPPFDWIYHAWQMGPVGILSIIPWLNKFWKICLPWKIWLPAGKTYHWVLLVNGNCPCDISSQQNIEYLEIWVWANFAVGRLGPEILLPQSRSFLVAQGPISLTSFPSQFKFNGKLILV